MTPDEEILAIFQEHDDPFLGTADVKGELGYSYQGTKKRLDGLAESGDLERKQVGGAWIYWLPERAD